MKKIIIIEPYYGGSHKAFISALITRLPCNFELYTLPARKWKWRMRLAAPYFANLMREKGDDLSTVDAFLCSPFLDVAAFKGLLPKAFAAIPVYTFFHENQFAYPVQVNDQRDFHFALTNFTTALASDRLAFNSEYNLESFLVGCDELLGMIYDMDLGGQNAVIRRKSTILYPGLDFTDIDQGQVTADNHMPVILWNHRWEHDKNPDFFFRTLFDLHERGPKFKLIVVGESFRRKPEIFEQAKGELKDCAIQFGYVRSRSDYLGWLNRADIAVSTANHEFFGISVIEAVRAGCRPLLPSRLSYKELFPVEFLYEEAEFKDKLVALLRDIKFSLAQGRALTEKFSWPNLHAKYVEWLGL